MMLKKLGLVTVVALVFCGSWCSAQNIVRIEEDWALRVISPDEQLDAPQIATGMLPFGTDSNVFLHIDFNHGTYPDFSAGGIQLHADEGDSNLANRRLLSGSKLVFNSENIRWTQVAKLQGGTLSFGIENGKSNSWGDFGGEGTYIHTATETNSFEEYDVADSVANSGALYASNRAAHLTLLRVRIYNSLGEVVEIPVQESAL